MTCYDTSQAPDRHRAPHTGRGSDSLVLIEAGASIRSFTVCIHYTQVLIAVVDAGRPGHNLNAGSDYETEENRNYR